MARMTGRLLPLLDLKTIHVRQISWPICSARSATSVPPDAIYSARSCCVPTAPSAVFATQRADADWTNSIQLTVPTAGTHPQLLATTHARASLHPDVQGYELSKVA